MYSQNFEFKIISEVFEFKIISEVIEYHEMMNWVRALEKKKMKIWVSSSYGFWWNERERDGGGLGELGWGKREQRGDLLATK